MVGVYNRAPVYEWRKIDERYTYPRTLFGNGSIQEPSEKQS